jgi:hypothetical protein
MAQCREMKIVENDQLVMQAWVAAATIAVWVAAAAITAEEARLGLLAAVPNSEGVVPLLQDPARRWCATVVCSDSGCVIWSQQLGVYTVATACARNWAPRFPRHRDARCGRHFCKLELGLCGV